MAKEFDGINNSLRDFLLAQPLFFVATAPSGSGGHVNLSPKGLDGTFAIISDSCGFGVLEGLPGVAG